jgi:hypothetical protein
MGVEKIGYGLLFAVTVAGAAVTAYAVRKRRPLGTGLALALLGLSGLLFWGVFLGGLKETLGEAIEAGEYERFNLDQDILLAKYRQQPLPKASDNQARKIAAWHSAERTARRFGWTNKELIAAYRGTSASTQSSNR